MSSRSLTWRRIGVGAVAVATVAAGSPLLLSTAANAVPASRLVITQNDGRTSAAAGTCTAFTVTPETALGTNEIDAATFTVRIGESPASDTQDVDFCTVQGGTPFAARPGYTNANQLGGDPEAARASTQTYAAGPSITPASAGATGPSEADEGNPDRASGTSPAVFDDAESINNNNPSGEDTASFRATGPVVFGVVALIPGSVTIDAFVNENDDRDRDSGETTVAQTRTLTVTPGGRQGSVEAANAVRQVRLVDVPDGDEESFAALGSGGTNATHDLAVSLFNVNGDRVAGVRPVLTAQSGPNAPSAFAPNGTFVASCDQIGNQGFAAPCTYSASQVGTDVLVAYVNQSGTGATSGRESTEPADTVSATTTAPTNTTATAARTLVLTPESAALAAGQRQPFTATVKDANGAPVSGVSVRFDEAGAGAFVNPTNSTATSTVTIVTDTNGQAVVQFASTASESGTNTITATITTTGTQCTTTGGQCSDTSPVTIAASTASPSPTASPTASATPTATMTASPGTEPGSRYRGLSSPVRVLDTRLNSGPRRSGEIILDLSNRITDANATTAVLNVTVTNGTRRGFLVAYPTGTTKPGTSNVNFETNQTQANEVVVRLSADRKVSLFVDSAAAHVIADLVGSFTTSTDSGVGEVTTNAPVRAFDSRNTATPTRRNEVVVDLTGRIPSGSTDAVLNVTVTRTSARGFVTVFPTGTARPGTSNVNFEPRQTQANEVITKVGTGSNANKVSFFIDSASAALIVDVVGAVSSTTDGQTFTALSSPQRALDTRNNSGSRRNGNINLVLPSSVPANATGVILNVTATNGTRPGFVTVFPGGSTNPGTSNVNFPTSLTQANEVTTGLGPNNDVTLFVGGANAPAAHVIVDVVGYLTD